MRPQQAVKVKVTVGVCDCLGGVKERGKTISCFRTVYLDF